MATEKLEIVVGADVQEVVQKLDQISKVAKTSMQKTATSFDQVKVAMKSVQVEAIDTDKAFREAMDRISNTVDKNVSSAISDFHKLDATIDRDIASSVRSIKTLEDQFQHFGGVTNKYAGNAAKHIGILETSLKKLPNVAGQASQGMLNFTRVVQDAPFGIIGIANNIDPLIQSFTALRASTGSARGAFAALSATLIGPAGIALAVSTITSLLVVFSQAKQKAASETKKLKEEEDVYAETLAKEKVKLDNLFAVATAANVPLKARKEAIKELRENYGAYLKDFKDEEILAGKAADAYQRLATALINVARAKAAEAQQIENSKKILENEGKIAKLREKAQKDAAKAKPDIGVVGGEGVFREGTQERKIENIFKEARKQSEALRKENQSLNEEQKRLAEAILENQVEPFTEVKKKTKEVVDILKEYKEALRLIEFKESALGISLLNEKIEIATSTFEDFIKKGINPQSDAFKRVQGDLNRYLGSIRDINKETERAQPLPLEPSKSELPKKADKTSALVITPEALQLQGEYLLKIDEMVAKLKLLQQLGDVAMSGLNAGIDQFFNALANNQDPFEALTQSVKRLIVELAAAVVKALVLKAIANAIAPGSGSVTGFFSSSSVIRGDQLRTLTFLRI
jgi:hypothetical protein